MNIRATLPTFLCLLFLTSGSSLRAQDSTVPAAESDGALGEQTNRILADRGLRPLADLSGLFLVAIFNENPGKSFSLIQTTEDQRTYFTDTDPVRAIIESGQKVNGIDLVGFRFYSTSVVSLVYLITTADGPLCIRLNLYTHGNKVFLHGASMSGDWDDMDAEVNSVTRLPATLALSFERKLIMDKE